METIYTSIELHELDNDLSNIVTINNNNDDADDDIQDYDLDYDQNDHYYELLNS